MRSQRRPAPPLIPATVRALVAGTLLIAAVGSCELPKPKIPSIGTTPFLPVAAEPITPFPPAAAEPITPFPPAAAEPITPFPPAAAEPTANVGARVMRT